MWKMVVPFVGVLLEFFKLRKGEGMPSDVAKNAVGKVGAAVENYLGRDEKLLQSELDAVERARRHDIDMAVRLPVIDLLRGIVRPVVTLAAFCWYVYARSNGISMLPEDYAIIGGIVAFWFGFRPFEKVGGGGGKV